MRAKAGIERLRSLVEAGVAPRAQLAQAEAAIADAEDAALLRRTIYGNELTDEQADEMLAAAERAASNAANMRWRKGGNWWIAAWRPCCR